MGEQHMDALALANEVRLGKADLKRKIAADDTGGVLCAVLEGKHGRAGACFRVVEALVCARRIGPTKARRLVLAAGGRSFERRVGELTDRQRGVLSTFTREYLNDPRLARDRAAGAAKRAAAIADDGPLP